MGFGNSYIADEKDNKIRKVTPAGSSRHLPVLAARDIQATVVPLPVSNITRVATVNYKGKGVLSSACD